MESVTSPVCHIVQKFVIFHNDERIFRYVILAVAEVRIFNMYSTSCCADILAKSVVDKNNCSLIASDVEGCYSLEIINDDRIIEKFIRVYDLLEEVAWGPDVVNTDFELDIILIRTTCATERRIHCRVLHVEECVWTRVLRDQNLLNVCNVPYKPRILYLNHSLETTCV